MSNENKKEKEIKADEGKIRQKEPNENRIKKTYESK